MKSKFYLPEISDPTNPENVRSHSINSELITMQLHYSQSIAVKMRPHPAAHPN